jgi:parallel beta-helix repeat protein
VNITSRRVLAIGLLAVLIGIVGSVFFTVDVSVSGTGATVYVDDDNVVGPWDGTVSHPYQNITSGLAHASNGDVVHVFSGTYAENVVVDKSISLIGESKPVIDAMGGIGVKATFDSTVLAYGLVVEGFDITNSNFGIVFTMKNVGNFNNTSGVIGDIVLANNTISSVTDGFQISVMDVGYFMYGNGTLTMGDFRIANNVVNCGSIGVNFLDFLGVGYEMHNSSSFHMGNIEITNNNLTASCGIYMRNIDHLGTYMDGESSFTMGNIVLGNNTIENGGMMLHRFEYLGNHMRNSSKFTMGNIDFSHNKINSKYQGIDIEQFDMLGYDMYDNSRFTMGSILLNDNLINSNTDGIYFGFGMIGYLGTSIYDNAVFAMGNVELNENRINSTYRGISVAGLYTLGYDMYGNSSFTMGSFILNDNVVNSTVDGIFIGGFEELGETLNGTSSFTMGNIESCRNTVNSTNVALGFDQIVDFGTDMYGNSLFSMGDILVNDNTLYGFLGIASFGAFGANLYENSSCGIGNVQFSRNVVCSEVFDGITFYDLQPFGFEMHDFGAFSMGDFCVDNNVIASNGNHSGISCAERSGGFGINVYDNASALTGSFEFEGNNMSSCWAGIGLYSVKDATARNNTIYNCTYGIYMEGSASNRIYHNNFINNTMHASVDFNYTNTWDNGYPSGGNYWSNYTDLDNSKGQYQNETGSDGIWDHPYVIDANNTDHYPFSNLYDGISPTIGIPSRTPSGDVLPNQEVMAAVNVTDNLSGVMNVTLYYTIDNGLNWNSTGMVKNLITGLYEATIPGQEYGKTVRFRIEAFDNAGNNQTRDGAETYCIYQIVPESALPFAFVAFIITMLISAVLLKKKKRLTKALRPQLPFFQSEISKN